MQSDGAPARVGPRPYARRAAVRMPQTDRIQVCRWWAQRVRDHRQLMVFALVSLPKREHRTVNFFVRPNHFSTCVEPTDYAADHLTI